MKCNQDINNIKYKNNNIKNYYLNNYRKINSHSFVK